jgi:hypothetical protein
MKGALRSVAVDVAKILKPLLEAVFSAMTIVARPLLQAFAAMNLFLKSLVAINTDSFDTRLISSLLVIVAANSRMANLDLDLDGHRHQCRHRSKSQGDCSRSTFEYSIYLCLTHLSNAQR